MYSKKSFFLFAIIFLQAVIFSQSAMQKISPELAAKMSSVQSGELVKAWIYFTDKGNTSFFKLNPESVLSGKAMQRRIKVTEKGKDVLDFSDYPVSNSYIQQLEAAGVVIKHKSKWFNAVSAYIPAGRLQTVAALTFVKSLEPVRLYTRQVEVEAAEELPLAKQPDGVHVFNYGNSFTQNDQIKVPQVHNLGITGQGIIVAVMDAGFNRLSHESFATMNIIAKWDFVNNDPGVGDSTDMGTGTHGTQTLSTIGGFKEGQLIGPAFGAQYILAKTENTDTETPVEEDNWIAAAEWADSLGADVFSTSLGYLDYDPPYPSYTWQSMDGNTAKITRAADLAVKKGIVVVNSAGNSGFHSTQNTLGAPADGDSVIAVGAVTNSGTRSSFSSVGNTFDGRIKPDVMAMGSSVRVASTFSNTGYSSASGTSFSCPLAAGVAALVLCANPSLTPIQVREAMRNTASRASNPGREYGWGILDALAAVNYFQTPVELHSFAGTITGNTLELNWRTSSEKNNAGFEIHISTDGITFNKITFVDGAGTTTEMKDYSISIPLQERAKKLFVKLVQIDFNGTVNYLSTLTLEDAIPSTAVLVQNYPNPFNPETNISVDFPSTGSAELKVYSLLGSEIASVYKGAVQAGNRIFTYAPGNLGSGVYLLRVEFKSFSGEIATKMIKITYLR